MQTTRLLMCLVLISLTMCYTYIYFRAAVSQLNYWSLMSTTITFAGLFIYCGMQMVYQKKLEQPNAHKKYGLKYNDMKKK